MTLRIQTEFELRHQRQSIWPEAIKTFKSYKRHVDYYGLRSLNRKHRRLYSLGRKLVAQGMTAL